MVGDHTFLLLLHISHAFECKWSWTRSHIGSHPHLQVASAYAVGPQSFHWCARYYGRWELLGIRKSAEDRLRNRPHPVERLFVRVGRNILLLEPRGLDAESFCRWRAKSLQRSHRSGFIFPETNRPLQQTFTHNTVQS